jgi:hypothetical protein
MCTGPAGGRKVRRLMEYAKHQKMRPDLGKKAGGRAYFLEVFQRQGSRFSLWVVP